LNGIDFLHLISVSCAALIADGRGEDTLSPSHHNGMTSWSEKQGRDLSPTQAIITLLRNNFSKLAHCSLGSRAAHLFLICS
jgi:hypothetical protein